MAQSAVTLSFGQMGDVDRQVADVDVGTPTGGDVNLDASGVVVHRDMQAVAPAAFAAPAASPRDRRHSAHGSRGGA